MDYSEEKLHAIIKEIRNKNSCKNCYYWWRHLNKTEGHCIRNAPKKYIDRHESTTEKMWPVTFEYEGYGEYMAMIKVISSFQW
jgi:hypothetical protein